MRYGGSKMVDVERLYADRIGGAQFGKDTTVYKFAKIKSAKRAFMEAHPDTTVIDLGVGEHDGVAPDEIRETLAPSDFLKILQSIGYKMGDTVVMSQEVIQKFTTQLRKGEVHNPENRGYADNGILEFQQAAARYLNDMLGIDLPTDDSAAEYVIHGIGSKGILSLSSLPFINPNDVTIMTIPGYPVLGTHTKYLGGRVVNLPLTEENRFLPDLDNLGDVIENTKEWRRGEVKMFCVNYPNNPTGADATPEFWEKLVGLAHKHNFIIAHDAAYSGLKFNGEPTSPLQVDGGLEVSLAMHSLSKAFDMIGYRLAIVAGNPALIKAYGNVKDNSDSGQAKMIQKAGIVALEHPEFTQKIASKYERRLKTLISILNSHGFNAQMPDGTFFLYTRAPTGTKDGKEFATAEDASQYMLLEQGISVVPWDDVGHYIRFSATFESADPFILEGCESDDKKVFEDLDRRLEKLQFRFD